MAEPAKETWLVEEGIGEHRAILLEGGEIIAARLDWPGALATGHVDDAVLVSKSAGSTRGTARFANEEALVDRLPPDAAEGSQIRLKITRPAIGEEGRRKLAHAVPTDDAPCPAPTLAEQLSATIVQRFPVEGWGEVIGDAFAATIAFNGGSLQFSATPAMTLVDVDGALSPRQLAVAAAPAIAATIRRLEIGGSVGIDFPTLPDKSDRRAVDNALSEALADWPHERTAMNGFGFVQLVARLERVSILHRAAMDRSAAAARLLLRRAEAVRDPGSILLTCHPAVQAKLEPDWLDELSRRTGREVRIAPDPGLALEAGFAQAVTR